MRKFARSKAQFDHQKNLSLKAGATALLIDHASLTEFVLVAENLGADLLAHLRQLTG